MKRIILVPAALLVFFLALFAACSDSFLDIKPQGALSISVLGNQPGVDAMLVGAYSLLDGYHIDNNNTWPSDPVNWIMGSVPSDDAYKGSEQGDLGEITLLELYQWAPGNILLNQKYVPLYEGVVRTNQCLNLLATATGLTQAYKDGVTGEMLVLRAYYHFELYKAFGNIPYFTEKDTDFQKPNGTDMTTGAKATLDACIADLVAAIPLLPTTQAQLGRATKRAGQALLGKLYMYKAAYTGVADYNNAIAQLTAAATGISLSPCQRDLFTYATENAPEAIFSVQMSLSNAAQARNSNWLNQLANPVGGGFGCCGFHQASQNLVNAFKTDATYGLPLLTAAGVDQSNSTATGSNNVVDISGPPPPLSGVGGIGATTGDGPVDPRLDLTVGRDNVPYWDWAIHSASFIRSRSYSGPFSPKKMQPFATSPIVAGGWNGAANNGVNVPIIRLADVLLLLAEAQVETGALAAAQANVNLVRARAGNCAQGGFVSKGDYAGVIKVGAGALTDASITWATYKVGLYGQAAANTFTTNGAAYARAAVRFERRLELAMEGHRFFDLRRWDDQTPGYAATVLNAFVAVEKNKRGYYATANSFATINRWYPIPSPQIELSIVGGKANLTQNTGF